VDSVVVVSEVYTIDDGRVDGNNDGKKVLSISVSDGLVGGLLVIFMMDG
jgi:hypothetical protein